MSWSVEQALDHWQSEGLLTEKKADELRGSLPGDDAVPGRAIRIFAGLGAILVGLGVILFVASNWDYLNPLQRVIILLTGLIASGVAGYFTAFGKRQYRMTGLALLFLNAMIFGACIFLVAQIYHLPLNYWWGAFLWCLGLLYFAYAMESKLHLWAAVPVFILFIGWLRSTMQTGFGEFSFLFEDNRTNILGLFPALGVALTSIAVLSHDRPRAAFGEHTLFNWGMFLALFTLVITTIDREVFFPIMHISLDVFTSVLLGLCGLVALLALWKGKFRTTQGRWILLLMLLYVIFTHVLAWAPYWIGVGLGGYDYTPPMTLGLFALHIVMVFVLLLTVTWQGTLLRLPGLINMGIAGLGVAVFIQYVSWAYRELDRSIAFILGGLLILALSALLERKRRSLVSSIRA